MQRSIVIALAVLVSLPLVMKSRGSKVVSAPAAFSVISSPTVQISISGDVRHPGVYSVDVNSVTSAVIKMAVPVRPVKHIIPDRCSSKVAEEGDLLKFTLQNDGTGIILCDLMPANDRILLGIALDINSVSESDFELLPGVGPVMAKRIVEYRQKNGGKIKVEDLLQVEGIGEKKFKMIAKYF